MLSVAKCYLLSSVFCLFGHFTEGSSSRRSFRFRKRANSHGAQDYYTYCGLPGQDPWPAIDSQQHVTSASAPLYVSTPPSMWESRGASTGSASPRQQVVGIHDVILDEMMRAHASQQGEREEEMRPIPLQDPPKSKLKRQLSDDSPAKPPISSSTPSSLRCPPPSPKAPRTPQPETANTRFSFHEIPTEDASPATRGYPASSQCQMNTAQTLYRHDVHSGNLSPKRPRTEAAPESVPLRFLMNDSSSIGSLSPKRVKGENGVPMPPLLQKQSSQWIHSATEPSVFRFPDVSTMYNRNIYEHSEMMYNENRPRHIHPRQLEEHVRLETDTQLHNESIRDYESYYNVKPGPFISRPSNFEVRPARTLMREQSSPEKYKRVNYSRVCPCEACQPVNINTSCIPKYLASSPQKQTLRSQSNVDHSPNKTELQEMEQERYNRSLSKPEGPHGLHVLQRQINARARQAGPRVKESFLQEMRPDENAWTYNSDGTTQTPRPYNTCRQLFVNTDTGHQRRHRPDMPHGMLNHDASSIQHPVLYRSYDDYDLYIVPRSHETLPGYQENEGEAVHLQKRRQTISCPRDASRPYSPQKARASSPGKQQPRGLINVRMSVQDVARDEKEFCEKLKRNSPPTCTCKKVQEEIFKIAKNAFSNAQRKDTSADSFDRSILEVHATNAMLTDALNTAKALRELCGRHKTIHDIYSGSVVIALQCSTLASVENLREQYRSGELRQLMYRTFVTERLKRRFGLKYVLFSVEITDADFRRCSRELEETLSRSHVTKRTPTPVHRLSPLKRKESKSVDDLENIPACPQLPVRMRSSTSTPSLLTLSPVASPCYSKSPTTPTTPTKRNRFSFSVCDRRTRTKSPAFRERKNSLSSLTELSSRRSMQYNNGDRSPCSPSMSCSPAMSCSPSMSNFPIFENEAYPAQPSPRLRKSLEDITSDLSNIHT